MPEAFRGLRTAGIGAARARSPPSVRASRCSWGAAGVGLCLRTVRLACQPACLECAGDSEHDAAGGGALAGDGAEPAGGGAGGAPARRLDLDLRWLQDLEA